MKNATITTIQDILNTYNYLDFLELDFDLNLEDFIENIKSQEDNIYYQEEIYYYQATKFLLENDPTLTTSIEYAREYGYTLENIDSCKLATILLQEYTREDYYNFLSELEDLTED